MQSKEMPGFPAWKLWNRRLGQCFYLLLLGCIAATPAFAAPNILVLTTNGTGAAAKNVQDNCKNEFKSITGATVDDIDTLTTNNLIAADFTPAGGGSYDLVVICPYYNPNSTSSIDSAELQANIKFIENAVKTRMAKAFFIFDEPPGPPQSLSSPPRFYALLKNSTAGLSASMDNIGTGGTDQTTNLNTGSPYSTDFSGLAIYGNSSFRIFSGVPIDNALYTPESHPIAPGSTTVVASTLFVPQPDSYLDAKNVPQGACLFATFDVSAFDNTRYNAPPSPPAQQPYHTHHAGKIAAAALNAIKPGTGACGIAAPDPLNMAVPMGSKGWLSALAALLGFLAWPVLRKRLFV
ncbi:MAG: hypothetical protein LBP52_04255 [Burkholderiaceae bacterium]|jgi:hypothetical protein|nr:hypothetical protein [Burkholderiaceae bacterium]